VTYEKLSASWSRIKGDAYFDRINDLPEFVASTTLRQTAWNASLIRGDVGAEVCAHRAPSSTSATCRRSLPGGRG
jgi:hypothetical protein